MNCRQPARISARHAHGGFTLVEIMIAVLIGLVLTGGLLQLLASTKQTYRFNEALARTQENGRFALEILNRDIRMAGFTGCPAANTIVNLLNNNTSVWWEHFGSGTARGFDGGQAFALSGPAFGSSAGNRLAGTDALTLLQGGGDEYTLTSHSPASSQMTLDRAPTLVAGSLVMVCDAQRTTIFQITAIAGSTVTYGTGGGWSPGNSAAGAYKYRRDAKMVEFLPTAFYVGVGSAGSSRALYRYRPQLSGTTAGMVADELVENVENMQIHYGIDADANNQVDLAYVDATAVSNWAQVLSVRVGLLLASAEPNLNTASQRIVFPSNDTGDANKAGVSYTAGDLRLYQSYYATVGLRNRLP